MSATPGPWSVSGVRKAFVGEDCQRIVGSNGMALAFVPIGRDLPGALADCRLIAAAPELLAALESLLFDADQFAKVIPPYQHAESIVKARAAIAKATETTQ